MKILILGITGMLGHTLFRTLSNHSSFTVFGSARNETAKRYFSTVLAKQIITDIDAHNHSHLTDLLERIKPDVVVNCIGIVKQLPRAQSPLETIPINTLLPHQLAALCYTINTRLIHMSTDCVFSGKKGNYSEADLPDAYDLYGRSKLLGEVHEPHTLTLRTSIIGHELTSHHSLVEWFLSQQKTIEGFKHAIYTGLPTIELAHIIENIILHHQTLHGVYHVASLPINKFDLLCLIAQTYHKKITIHPNESFIIDRSLNATRFNEATGYTPPSWPDLIKQMYAFQPL